MWLAVGTHLGVKIWDLKAEAEPEKVMPLAFLQHETTKKIKRGHTELYEKCTSLCWNHDGSRLYAGFSDGAIRVYDVLEGNEP